MNPLLTYTRWIMSCYSQLRYSFESIFSACYDHCSLILEQFHHRNEHIFSLPAYNIRMIRVIMKFSSVLFSVSMTEFSVLRYSCSIIFFYFRITLKDFLFTQNLAGFHVYYMRVQ